MVSLTRRPSSGIFTDVLRWVFLPLREAFSLQFLAAAVWLFSCSVWNCMVQVYIDRLYAQQHFGDRHWDPLPDAGFAILPYIKEPHLADQWQTFILGSTLVAFMLLHPQRIKVLKRFCAIQGSVFLLRSITIGATLLPNPYSHCVNEHRQDENIFFEALAVMGGTRATCGDVLFSGHAANITIMALIWNEYCRHFLPPRAYVTVRSTGMWNAKRRTGMDTFLCFAFTTVRKSEAEASPAEAKIMARDWAMSEIARRVRAVMRVPKEMEEAIADLRKIRAEISSVGTPDDDSLPDTVKESCQSIEAYLHKARELLPEGTSETLKRNYGPLVASINEVAITVGAADFDHAIVDDCVQLRRVLSEEGKADDMEIFGRVLALFGRLGVHIPLARGSKANGDVCEEETTKSALNSSGKNDGERGSSTAPGDSAASDDEVDEDEIEDDSEDDAVAGNDVAPAVRTQLAQEASASGTLASPSEGSQPGKAGGVEEQALVAANVGIRENETDDPMAALAMQVAKPVSSSPLPTAAAIEKTYCHNLVLSRIFDSDLPLRASVRESGSSPPPGLASPAQAAPLVRWEHMAWSGSIALSASRLVPNPTDNVGAILSSEAVVNQWITEATDEGSLSRMYEGWTSWI